LSWDGERDSRGGFDKIGAEGSFVGSAWALSPYTYDLRTTLAMRGAGGCLTTKKGAWCRAVLVQCRACFVDLFHFLLLFLLFVNFISYFLLLKQG